MKQKLKKIIDRHTEGNYLLSDADKWQMIDDIIEFINKSQ